MIRLLKFITITVWTLNIYKYGSNYQFKCLSLGIAPVAILSGRTYNLRCLKINRPEMGNMEERIWRATVRSSQPYDFITKWRTVAAHPSYQGIIVGSKRVRGKVYALIDEHDVHTIMTGSDGVGKTTFFLYANLEYASASGMSFMVADTKGDVFRNVTPIAEKYYSYKISVIDLRNSLQSHHFNMLHLVNKYMDQYLENLTNVTLKAKAEKYAKIIEKNYLFKWHQYGLWTKSIFL